MQYYKNLVAKRNESIHVGPCEVSKSLYTRGAEGFIYAGDDPLDFYYGDDYPYLAGQMGTVHEDVRKQ